MVARGVEIALDIAPELPQVHGDRPQLEQVVMNLVVNAFEADAGAEALRQVTVRQAAGPGSEGAP